VAVQVLRSTRFAEEIALGRNRFPLISADLDACAGSPVPLRADTQRENDGMRFFTSLMIIFLIGCSAPRFAQAQQATSCKQCSDQRHARTGGYSAKTCQVEYERCMKNCQRK